MLSFCPLCQAKQGAIEANVLEEAGETHLLHLHCRHCHIAILAIVNMTPLGLSSFGMITDLSVADAQRLKSVEPVNAEEALNLHLFFRNSQNILNELSGAEAAA